VRPIVDRFDVEVLYGPMPNSTHWVDFRPEHRPAGSPVGDGRMADVEFRLLGADERLSVDPGGKRQLEVFHPPLRLLLTHWVYDAETRTLFTSDAFTHMWRSSERGPWVVDSTGDCISAEEMRSHLVATKFWWLPGANTEPIRRDLAEIFARYEIDTICPSFGCILRGRDVVIQHHELLQDVLEALADEPASIGIPEPARV
jgi:flavorubredoxin